MLFVLQRHLSALCVIKWRERAARSLEYRSPLTRVHESSAHNKRGQKGTDPWSKSGLSNISFFKKTTFNGIFIQSRPSGGCDFSNRNFYYSFEIVRFQVISGQRLYYWCDL